MPFLLHCRQFAFLKGIWEPWHHQNKGLLVPFLPFLFICNCWLLFQSSFLFPAWTLALDCTRMLIFQLQWLFQFFWLSSPLGLTHPPVAGVPWQLILHLSPMNKRPRGQESTHCPKLVGSVWMELFWHMDGESGVGINLSLLFLSFWSCQYGKKVFQSFTKNNEDRMVWLYLECFWEQARNRQRKQKLNQQPWLMASAYYLFANSEAQGSPWIPIFSWFLLTAFSDSALCH